MSQKTENVFDIEGKKVVFIEEVRFKGRQNIEWEEVKEFLKEYIGKEYEILETSDIVYIGSDFPDELKGSEDTKRLCGGNAKAKANATQGIPMLLAHATNKRWKENLKEKHNIDAKSGWYRYTARFALPMFNENNEITKHNIYRVEMLVRNASDNKLYLYDMVNVKKERETKYPT